MNKVRKKKVPSKDTGYFACICVRIFIRTFYIFAFEKILGDKDLLTWVGSRPVRQSQSQNKSKACKSLNLQAFLFFPKSLRARRLEFLD